MKRRLNEKANNNVVDLATTQLKELKSANPDMNEIFQRFHHHGKRRKSSEDDDEETKAKGLGG